MFKVLTEGCEPTKGSKYSACIDLRASHDVTIEAGATEIVGLGVAIYLEALKELDMFQVERFGKNYGSLGADFSEDEFDYFMRSHYLALEPRSSLRAKGLIVGTGVIDLDFRDELKIIIHNPMPQDGVISSIIGYDLGKQGMSVEEASNLLTNDGLETNFDYEIKKGDRIAQVMLHPHKSYLMNIDTEEERNGGLGSTGTK